MKSTLTTSCGRLLVPCIRRRRLILSILILYGIATYFLRDQIWDAFNHVRQKTASEKTLSKEAPQRKLIFLQVLFRHGHHSPFSSYPSDPNPKDSWIEGFGQLTQLGRLQHYLVGKYLRNMYDGFLSYNVQEVDCMSSLASRSLYAAYSFLAGFYPAPPEKRMASDLPYQPIYCTYYPLRQDKYLQSLPNCKASELDKATMLDTREAIQFMAQYQELYSFWSKNSGLGIINYANAGSFYKTLLAEKTQNLTIPSWAEATWNSLRENSNICYHFHFKTRLLQRLRAGPVVGEIVGKMKHKVQNPKSKLKVYVYSGHGSNVAAVLNALQVFNDHCPTYASTILFELYEEEDGSHTIRLLYSNVTTPENHIPYPHILRLPGCGEYCSLEELERQTSDLFPLDWEKECLEEDPDRIRQLLSE